MSDGIEELINIDDTEISEIDEEYKIAIQNQKIANNKAFADILNIYSDYTKSSLKIKEKNKKWFCGVSLGILSITIIVSLTFMYLILKSDIDFLDKIIQLIPVIISFLTPLLILPSTIAKYLFTTKDEDNMLEILKLMIGNNKIDDE